MYRPQDAPRYEHGFIIVVITAIIAGVLGLVYRFICVWENKRRDQTGTLEGFEHAYEDDLTDKTVSYSHYVPTPLFLPFIRAALR